MTPPDVIDSSGQPHRNVCPKHPGIDTFVMCMACGRPFCRLCNPLRVAGHYCPECYSDNVAFLKEKLESRAVNIVKVSRVADKEKNEKVVGRQDQDTQGSKNKSSHSGSDSIDSSSRESTINLQTDFAFPIGFVEKDHFEKMPEIMKHWKGLSISILIGAVAWTLICAVTHHRYWYVSVLIAAGVSFSVAYILGGRFDPTGALVATCVAILSLVIGDLVLQLLVVSRVIGNIDSIGTIPTLTRTPSPGSYLKEYAFKLFLLRLLPSAAVAFLVAWWPFKKRLGWRGFERR